MLQKNYVFICLYTNMVYNLNMLSVLLHQITLHPLLISNNWQKYKHEYQDIENTLLKYDQIENPFIYDNNILLGFNLSNVNDEIAKRPLNQYLKTKTTAFLRYNDQIFSRGLDYYPGLQKHQPVQDTVEQIYTDLLSLLEVYEDHIRISTNDMFVVAAEDYIRNYLLILYQAFRTLSFKYVFLKESSFEYEIINNKFRNNIESVLTVLFSHLTNKNSTMTVSKEEVVNLCNLSRQLLLILLDEQQVHKFNTTDIIRESREVDSLRHIYTFAQKVAKHKLSPSTCLIGIEYGGLELPFAINAVRILQGKQQLKNISVRASNYSANVSKNITVIDLALFSQEQDSLQKARQCVVVDDSITTGRSISRIVNSMPSNIKRVYIACVTFKVSHRYHHLIMPDHGGLNPTIARHATLLCQSNYAATYKNNSYLDRSGKFNINKDTLYRILGAQHA